ncbi:hypothetical protein ACPA9J_25450 [Pseudomonas aeruginosa]
MTCCRAGACCGLILLVALLVVAGQIHRLVQGALLRTLQTQALNLHLERVNAEAEALNRQARPGGRPAAPPVERELRAARDALAPGGGAHRGLGATSQALSQAGGAPGHGPWRPANWGCGTGTWRAAGSSIPISRRSSATPGTVPRTIAG